MDIDKIKFGAEMNRMVSEIVMGFTPEQAKDFKPSTDIRHAWMVRDFVISKFDYPIWFSVEQDLNGRWEACFQDNHTPGTSRAWWATAEETPSAHTAQMAICRASLRVAMEMWGDG